MDSKAKPPFPRQTSVWWFDCKSAQANPLGLSSDLRASIYVGNGTHGHHASLEEPITISPAGYSSQMLQVDKDVEIVSGPVLAGHSNSDESYITHEATSANSAYSTQLHHWSKCLLLVVTLVTLSRISF